MRNEEAGVDAASRRARANFGVKSIDACAAYVALYSAIAVNEESRPFGWEVVERDGGEWMRKETRSFIAEFRVDGHSKPWHVVDMANNSVVLSGASTLSLLRMCRVLEAVVGVLLVKSTNEIPMQ